MVPLIGDTMAQTMLDQQNYYFVGLFCVSHIKFSADTVNKILKLLTILGFLSGFDCLFHCL